MTDLSELKQGARITRDAHGELVVQIPLAVWAEFLSKQEREPSLKQRILDFSDEWQNNSANDMSDILWVEFEEFLKPNRANSHD